MAVYFTADLHIGHRNIIDFCNRPDQDLDEMHNDLINNWQNTVKHDSDVVWVMGDLSIDSQSKLALEIASQLRGIKRLITGNHDRAWVGHSKPTKYIKEYEKVFDMVQPFSRTKVNSHKVLLSHFPYEGDSRADSRYDTFRLSPGTAKLPLLHGHTHSTERVSRSSCNALQIHVGVDAWNYTPATSEQIEQYLK